jgi:hypothetical protein
VRVCFQRKVLDHRGPAIAAEPIEDPAFHQGFFSRMDESLFLQREELG